MAKKSNSRPLPVKEEVMNDFYKYQVISPGGEVMLETDDEQDALTEAREYAEQEVDEDDTEATFVVYKIYKAVRATQINKVTSETVQF